jgi:hypothetical protein
MELEEQRKRYHAGSRLELKWGGVEAGEPRSWWFIALPNEALEF